MHFNKMEVPPALKVMMESNVDVKDIEVFASNKGLDILKTVDNTPKWGWLKHASVSRRDRYPTWEEILAVKEFIFGDVDCMMIMPKKENYVNVHKNCFHIWQTPEEWGIG